MSAELEKVKSRIRAMSARTIDRGCTEDEAMVAAKMIGELLETFGLTMSDVEVKEQNCKQVTIDTGRHNKHPIHSSLTRIAEFTDCRVWVSRGKNLIYNFYGLESDVEMAVYLHNILRFAMDNEVEKFKASDRYLNSSYRKRDSTSFLYGMSHRINSRLNEMKDERDSRIDAARTGTALVVLKGQIVEREFSLLKVRLHTTYNKSKYVRNGAYYDGAEAGNRVNLSRPLNNDTNITGYLK